jgi:hypothetical protein
VTTGHQRLEALLRSAADEAAWPATPDLRDAVVARITGSAAALRGGSGETAEARPSGVARPTRIRLARALAIALIALLLIAGAAIALGFRLPGLEVRLVDRLPPAGTGFDLGSPVPLDAVRNDEPPRVLLPASLPAPSSAFVLGVGPRRLVTLVWRAADGEPRLPGTDLSLAITALAGRTDETLMTKELGPGTTIEPVTVGSDRGWWIAGAPHEMLVKRADGSVDVVTSRLAGDTLLFVRGGTLYRLETALGRDATLAVAASLR